MELALDITKISPKNGGELNMLLEIASGTNLKYEFDQSINCMTLDRVIAMNYPCDYGFIPNTLAGDGDPIDVILIKKSPSSLSPGIIISVKPIGILMMEDDKGRDDKIIAIPSDKIEPESRHIKSVKDIDEYLIERIKYFFLHYKDLEIGKWAKILGMGGIDDANKTIDSAIQSFSKQDQRT